MGELEQESQEYFELLLMEGYPYEVARELAHKYTQLSITQQDITNV